MSKAFQIKDFPNYYVTDTGDVYSRNYNRTGRIKKIAKNKHRRGYLYCTVHNKDASKKKSIHRLVAEAFIPNPDNKLEINHKNGNKADNRVENLEWVTRSENEMHAYRILNCQHATGKRPHLWGKNNWKTKIVQQIKDGKVIAEFYGTCEAERKTGICCSNISACCHGKHHTIGGYKWKYK